MQSELASMQDVLALPFAPTPHSHEQHPALFIQAAAQAPGVMRTHTESDTVSALLQTFWLQQDAASDLTTAREPRAVTTNTPAVTAKPQRSLPSHAIGTLERELGVTGSGEQSVQDDWQRIDHFDEESTVTMITHGCPLSLSYGILSSPVHGAHPERHFNAQASTYCTNITAHPAHPAVIPLSPSPSAHSLSRTCSQVSLAQWRGGVEIDAFWPGVILERISYVSCPCKSSRGLPKHAYGALCWHVSRRVLYGNATVTCRQVSELLPTRSLLEIFLQAAVLHSAHHCTTRVHRTWVAMGCILRAGIILNGSPHCM